MSAPPESTLFIRRNPAPGMNLVDHARGLGINLKSKSLKTYGSPRRGVASPRSQTAPLAHRSAKSCPPSVICFPQPSQYIENIVIPLSANSDEHNVNNSMTPRPFSASFLNPKLRPRSANRARSSLPNMRSNNYPNCSPGSSAKTVRTLSTYLDKYNVSSTPFGPGIVLGAQGQENQKKWNSSDQAVRFETEQLNRAKGLTLKRTSEIRPHRIDRMYFMSGTPIRPSHKYEVDDGELERLKSLSRAREESRHYGRGLSHRGDRYRADITDKELPHQPPPSSLSQNPDLHPLVPEGTILNQEPRDTDLDDDSVTIEASRPSTAVTGKKEAKIKESPHEDVHPVEVEAKESDSGLPAEEIPEKPIVNETRDKPPEENTESKEDILAKTDEEYTAKESKLNAGENGVDEKTDLTSIPKFENKVAVHEEVNVAVEENKNDPKSLSTVDS